MSVSFFFSRGVYFTLYALPNIRSHLLERQTCIVYVAITWYTETKTKETEEKTFGFASEYIRFIRDDGGVRSISQSARMLCVQCALHFQVFRCVCLCICVCVCVWAYVSHLSFV